MFQIEYPKPVRLAAMAAMALKILYQLICVIFFREALPLWALLILLAEGCAIFTLYRGERRFFTAIPFLVVAVLENFWFFSGTGTMLNTTSFHLIAAFLVAVLFGMSMEGRMYEHRILLMFFFGMLFAFWGYNLFLAFLNRPETGPFSLSDIRFLFLDPVAYGLCAAWASFSRFVHDLTDEEVEAQLEYNHKLLVTGMISLKEYRVAQKQLIYGRRKK